jgi:hypothetical protein
MSMINPIDPIGNGTRDRPACNALPRPTAPPRTPQFKVLNNFRCTLPPPSPAPNKNLDHYYYKILLRIA